MSNQALHTNLATTNRRALRRMEVNKRDTRKNKAVYWRSVKRQTLYNFMFLNFEFGKRIQFSLQKLMFASKTYRSLNFA